MEESNGLGTPRATIRVSFFTAPTGATTHKLRESIMNVPNHAQASRIASDLNKLARGESADDWRGNSYAGIVGYQDGGRMYTLTHWSTPIAQLHIASDGKVSVLMFNAWYISATTRSFQGRIYQALQTVHAINASDLSHIGHELGRKTHLREVLHLHPEIAV